MADGKQSPAELQGDVVEQTWPAGMSDGLDLSCGDCCGAPRFDYRVTEEFWRQWVPEDDKRLGVICLPCLDQRCKGEGLMESLVFIQWLGTGHTVEMSPARAVRYESRDGQPSRLLAAITPLLPGSNYTRERLLSQEAVEAFGTGYWRAVSEKQQLQRRQRHGEAKDIALFRRGLEAWLDALDLLPSSPGSNYALELRERLLSASFESKIWSSLPPALKAPMLWRAFAEKLLAAFDTPVSSEPEEGK